jgi:hypothetical protein
LIGVCDKIYWGLFRRILREKIDGNIHFLNGFSMYLAWFMEGGQL